MQHFYSFVVASLILLACLAVREQDQTQEFTAILSNYVHPVVAKKKVSNITTFSLTIGTVKLDGLLPSDEAVRSIAGKLTGGKDDIIAFLETDTMQDDDLALWNRLKALLLQEYAAPETLPFKDTPKEGSRYALSVFVRRDKWDSHEVMIDDPVQWCCPEGEGHPKGIMTQKVSIGQHGLLLIIGVQLAPKDKSKARQVEQLLDLMRDTKKIAATQGRQFQAVLVGDFNSRLILPRTFPYPHGPVWPHKVRMRNAKVSIKSYWVADGCTSDPVGEYEKEDQAIAGVRCCVDNRCIIPQDCPLQLTFAEASQQCKKSGQGFRVCTKPQLVSNGCCGTDGYCDSQKVWTSTEKAEPKETLKIDDETSNDILRLLSFSDYRKDLLDWDSDYFRGMAISGDHVKPSRTAEKLKESFYSMMDWWRTDEKMTPTMPTYQMTPWFELPTMFQEFVQLVNQQVLVTDTHQKRYRPPQKQNLMITAQELLEQIDNVKKYFTPSRDARLEKNESLAPAPQWESSIWKGVWDSSGLQQCANMIANELRFIPCGWLIDGCVGDIGEEMAVWRQLVEALQENRRIMIAGVGDEMQREQLMAQMRHYMKQIHKKGGAFEERGEQPGFLASLPGRMFSFQSKAAKTTYKSKEAQKYLNFNEKNQPVYLQLGWLDRLGYSQGDLGEFNEKVMLSFKIDTDLLGFDHLMVHGRMQFTV